MDTPTPNTPEILWRTKYAAAYTENERMVIRYRFPYSKSRESALLGAYNISPKERRDYYNTLLSMCERNIAISNYLKEAQVPSVLTFDQTYQLQEDTGIICIYCIPAVSVTPITQCLLSDDCSALTVLDIFLRLAHILRDISKTPMSPVLRYLDMDDVYLTQDNKILLGGFYYAAAEGLSPPPPYLQDAAPIITEELRAGATGDAGTDMHILARIAWNLFSGLPWDTAHTAESWNIPPRYAPTALLRTINIGLDGDAAECNSFRKRLMNCRKELAKADFAQIVIPACNPLKKEYRFTTVSRPAPQQAPESNGAKDTKPQNDKGAKQQSAKAAKRQKHKETNSG